MGRSSADATVRLHPDDLARMQVPAEELAPGRALHFVADTTVEPGGCVLESGATTVDASIGPALDRAFAAGVPYLVNVLTDPAVAYPRSTANRALQGLNVQGGNQLNQMNLVAGPASRLQGDDGSQTFAENWLKQWDLFAGIENPAVLPVEVANDQD